MEQEMAKAQNIPFSIYGEPEKKEGKEEFGKPDMFSEKLHQWRILIYAIKITGLEPEQVSSINFSIFPNSHTRLPVGKTRGIQIGKGEIGVNKIRVHYCFSKTMDIDSFIQNSCGNITVFDQNGKLFAEGRSLFLKHFCLHQRIYMKAEKVFKRIPLQTLKMDTFSLDVNTILKFKLVYYRTLL